jgi:hypothetical protein
LAFAIEDHWLVRKELAPPAVRHVDVLGRELNCPRSSVSALRSNDPAAARAARTRSVPAQSARSSLCLVCLATDGTAFGQRRGARGLSMDSEVASGSQAADPSRVPENLVRSDSYGEVGHLAVDSMLDSGSQLEATRLRRKIPNPSER